MTRIGPVWDRTTQVLAGRGAILTAIAAGLLFVPSAVQAVANALAAAPMGGPLRSLLGLVVFGTTIWGTLALSAVASDPAVTRQRAVSAGLSRMPAALGVVAVVGLVLFVLLIPAFVLLASSGIDWTRASNDVAQTGVDLGRAGGAMLYLLVFMLLLLAISARLVPLFAVIVNERRGLGAITRSVALTRGAGLRLAGVLILFALVMIVTLLAASSVVGVVARLLLGPEAPAGVTAAQGIAGAAVTAVFGTIQAVFGAQYYVAAREAVDGRGAIEARDAPPPAA